MWKQFAIFLALSLAIGCGGGNSNTDSGNGNSSSSVSGGGKKYRIAVIPKGTSHEFWKSVHAGAENAAKELGNVEIPRSEERRGGKECRARWSP